MFSSFRKVVKFGRGELKDRLGSAILKIEERRHQLHILKSRLEARMQNLIEALEKARELDDSVRITLFTDECSELKKVINAVSLCEVALTQIITRFESIRDISEAMKHMSSAADIIKHIYGKEEPTPALENIASEATRTLSETLADLSNLSCGFDFDLNSSVDGLTEDAERYALYLASEINEPIPSSIQQAKGRSLFKKMRSLTNLTDSQNAIYAANSSTLSGKVEEKVRRFFKERGEYNIIEASVVLNLPINLVEEVALKMISEESSIKLAPEVA
ncbi:MAG: hypothetical protein QXJ86_01280 [Nitrososphaerales archaeon]